MRRRTIALLSAAAVAASLTVAGLVVAHPGSAEASGSTIAVQPAVQADGHQFFTDSQIDAAWKAATTDYPQALPVGVSFPSTAPAFFHPNDGKQHIFEENLPAEFAASYWRCAWLDVANTANTAPTSDVDAAATATTELAKYATLPGVAGNVNVKQNDADIASYALTQGLTPDVAEFQIDCTGFYQGSGQGK